MSCISFYRHFRRPHRTRPYSLRHRTHQLRLGDHTGRLMVFFIKLLLYCIVLYCILLTDLLAVSNTRLDIYRLPSICHLALAAYILRLFVCGECKREQKAEHDPRLMPVAQVEWSFALCHCNSSSNLANTFRFIASTDSPVNKVGRRPRWSMIGIRAAANNSLGMSRFWQAKRC